MAHKNKYPGVYARWKTLWIRYTDASGKQVRESTELPVGQERAAYAMLKGIQARIRAAARAVEELESDGPILLEAYSLRWAVRRKERGIASASDDETRLKLHVLPFLIDGVPFGAMRLDDVQPLHIRDLVRHLIAVSDPTTKLAPLSIRNIYGMLHTLFVDAKVEGLIVSNPCELPREELPKRRDKDATWRASAVFAHSEVEKVDL